MHDAIRKFNVAIACKTVVDHCQPLVAFDIPGTLEEFVEHSMDDILRRRDKACH